MYFVKMLTKLIIALIESNFYVFSQTPAFSNYGTFLLLVENAGVLSFERIII